MVLILSDDQVAALGELHVAAWKGSRDDVVKLVNEGYPVDGTAHENSPFYCTPLHLAVMSSRHALAKSDFLLLKGADINAQDVNGDTLLHRAVSSGDAALPVVKCLLEWNIKRGIENKDFDTPYDLAVKGGQTQIIEFFCQTNSSRLLLAAAKYKRIDLVQRCLERQQPNARAGRSSRIFAPERNAHLARAAVQGGDEVILNYLVENGLKLNEVEDANSILIAAVMHGDPAVFRFLLNLGWKFPKKIEKKHKKLVMKRAVRFAGVEMLEYLTANGFSINVGDKELVDKLRELAIRRRDSRVVDWLVQRGLPMYGAQALEAVEQREDVLNLFVANGVSVDSGVAKGPRRSLLNAALAAGRVDLADHLEREGLIAGLMEGREHSLLRDAAMMNNFNFFKDLVHRGLRLHATNAKGETLLHTAVKLGNQEIIAYFLDEGADISATDKKKQTVLHVVAAATSTEAKATIKYLLNNGADVLINEEDEDGWSVLHYAADRWDVALVDLLTVMGATTDRQTKLNNTPLSFALDRMDTDVCSEDLVKTLFLLLSHDASWNEGHAAYFDKQMRMYGGKRDNDEESDEDDEDEDDSSEDSEQDESQPEDEEECDQGVNNDIAEEDDDEENEDGQASHWCDESDGGSSKEDDYVASGEDNTSVRSWDSLYSRQSMTSDDYRTLAELQNDQPVEDDWGYSECYNSDPDHEDNIQSAEQDPLVIRALIICVKAWLRERKAGDTLTPIPWSVIVGGPLAVEEYYAKLGKSIPERVRHHHRVCVLGSKGSGKTTLVKSLDSGPPELHRQDKCPVVGIDVVSIGTRDGRRISFWDIAGLDIIEAAVPRFFTEKTLYLICVDLNEYRKKTKAVKSDSQALNDGATNRFVAEHIFKWFRLIITQHPKAKFLIVGTKGDKVTPATKERIQRDFRARLKQWEGNFRDELDDFGYVRGEGPTTHIQTVVSYSWINVSCTKSDDVDYARKQVLEAIDCGDGISFGPKHTSVLGAIKRRVMKKKDTSVGTTTNVESLCRKLAKTIDDVTLEQCHRCLDDLQEVGKVWFLRDPRTTTTTVFLEPAIITQALCTIIKSAQGSKNVVHEQVNGLKIWKDLSDRGKLRLKRALHFLHLAYPVTTTTMQPNSDLIVPGCWSRQAKEERKHFYQQPSLLDRSAIRKQEVVTWEYELSAEVSASTFVQFACTCNGVGVRTIAYRNYFQDGDYGDAIVQAWLERKRDRVTDVIRIEVAANDADDAWRRLVPYVQAVDVVLSEWPGLTVTQYSIDTTSNDSNKKRHELSYVITILDKETSTGKYNDRKGMPWLPPSGWLANWNDPKALRRMRKQDAHTELRQRVEAIHTSVIADPFLRLFPAVWTLEYNDMDQTVEVQMLSDYSYKCFQEDRIIIEVPAKFLADYGPKLQVGLAILANVVPEFIDFGILQKVFEVFQSGFENKVERSTTLHNMIPDRQISPSTTFTKVSSVTKLVPGEALLMLLDLLRLHDDKFHPLMIPKLSRLESAVTTKGHFVWASRQEIDVSNSGLKPCFMQSMGPLSGNMPVEHKLEIVSITWTEDIKGIYCEWELLDTSSTPWKLVRKGETSKPTDEMDPLTSDPSVPVLFYSFQSENDLSKHGLRLQIKKKPSPWRQRVLQCSTRLAAWSTSVLGEGVAENLAMGEFVIAIKNPKTSSIAEVKCRISSSA